MKAEKIALLGVLTAFSLVLSYFDSVIPFFSVLPGLKIGLANIIVLFALYKHSFKDAFIIVIVKCFLSSFLFGSFLSFIYGFFSSLVSLFVMNFIKSILNLNIVAVSTLGAVSHNITQCLIAVLILQNKALIYYYLPVLALSGAFAGIITGLITSNVIKRLSLG